MNGYVQRCLYDFAHIWCTYVSLWKNISFYSMRIDRSLLVYNATTTSFTHLDSSCNSNSIAANRISKKMTPLLQSKLWVFDTFPSDDTNMTYKYDVLWVGKNMRSYKWIFLLMTLLFPFFWNVNCKICDYSLTHLAFLCCDVT